MEKRLADKNALNCTALSTLVHSGRAFVYDPALNCQLFKVFLTLTPSLHASAMSMVEAVNCGQECGWTLAGVVELTPPWLQPSRSMSKTMFTDHCPWSTIAALKFLKDEDQDIHHQTTSFHRSGANCTNYRNSKEVTCSCGIPFSSSAVALLVIPKTSTMTSA